MWARYKHCTGYDCSTIKAELATILKVVLARVAQQALWTRYIRLKGLPAWPPFLVPTPA